MLYNTHNTLLFIRDICGSPLFESTCASCAQPYSNTMQCSLTNKTCAESWDRKRELNPTVTVGRAVCRWWRTLSDEETAGDRWTKATGNQHQIKAGNITEHQAVCRALGLFHIHG